MSFCTKCGASVSESQSFCGSCGASLIAVEAHPGRKRPRVARVMLWSLGIMFGLLALHAVLSEQNTQQPTSDTPHKTVSSAAEAPPPPSPPQVQDNPTQAYKIGQQFSVGYWSYLIHRAYWTPALGADLYSMERANAEFVVIDMTVRNDDTSASTLPQFQLKDAEGRTYSESSAGMASQGFFSVLEQLNPGVSKRGNIAFDVPPGRQYSLIASGGIESGEQVSVTLPKSATPKELSPAETPK